MDANADSAASCPRCHSHGWTLTDNRVDLCPCGAFEHPPRWVRNGDRACIIAHVKDPERPRRAAKGLLCAGCADRLAWTIGELPAQHDELALALAPTSGHGGRRSGPPEGRLPIVVSDGTDTDPVMVSRVADHRDRIAHVLASWCGLVVEEAGVRGPRGSEPTATAPWLLGHLDWATDQPWVDELHAEMRDLRSGALRLLSPRHQRRITVGPCGKDDCPGELRLTADDEEAQRMTCDICHRSVEARYWRAERRRLDGTVANPWLPMDLAATQYGVSLRTVQRWVAKGKLKTRGSPPLVKGSGIEGLLHALSRRMAS